MAYVCFLLLGALIGWFASFAYHYSQDAVEDTARGAWAMGLFLVLVLILVWIIYLTQTRAILGTIQDAVTATPLLGR